MRHTLPSKQLTSEIVDFVSTYLSKTKKYSLLEIESALAIDVKMSLGAELRALFLLSLMKEYHHEDENIQSEVRSNFAALKGSWGTLLLDLMQYQIFGFVASEKSYSVKQGRAYLSRLNVLDQSRCFWEGADNTTVDTLRYSQPNGEIKLDYQKSIFHLVNQNYLQLSKTADGIALAARAMPYYELSIKIMASLAIAGLKQATPLLVGKTKTSEDVVIYGADGQPLVNALTGQTVTVKKGNNMYAELIKAENSSVIVIDEFDEIISIMQQTNGEFFKWVLYYLDAMKLWSFLISPVLVGTSESGVGDSNLSQTHLMTLKTLGRAQMRIFSDELIEQVIKPMLEFNYLNLDSYGSFPVPDEDNTNTIDLLNAIGNAVRNGALSGADLAVVNRVKGLAGIENLKKAPN